MRRWLILSAAVAALAGCKNLDRDRDRSPRADRERGPADPASRTKPAAPKPDGNWLDGPTPGLAKVDTPPADSWTDPRDPSFDVNREVRGVLAGFVEDPDGRKVRDVFIEVEPADPAAAGKGAPVGVQTDRDGHFLIKGLKPKQTYILTARTKTDGRETAGRVYAQTSQKASQFVRIPLLEGLSLPGGPTGPAGGARDLPTPNPTTPKPAETPARPPGAAIPPPVLPSGANVPRPDPVPLGRDGAGSFAPSTADGTFSPIGAPPARTPTAVPTVTPPSRPDLTTEGPDGLKRPPTTSIPAPPPPIPSLPPLSGQSQSKSIRPRSEFVLLDTMGVPREFPSGRAGGLTLLDFMTTTCLPCQKALPTVAGLQSKYGLRGLEVVGVACDDATLPQRRALAARYQKDHELNYLLYVEPGSDPGGAMKRFGVRAFPTLVLVDGSGEVLWTGHPREVADLEQKIADRLDRAGR